MLEGVCEVGEGGKEDSDPRPTLGGCASDGERNDVGAPRREGQLDSVDIAVEAFREEYLGDRLPLLIILIIGMEVNGCVLPWCKARVVDISAPPAARNVARWRVHELEVMATYDVANREGSSIRCGIPPCECRAREAERFAIVPLPRQTFDFRRRDVTFEHACSLNPAVEVCRHVVLESHCTERHDRAVAKGLSI